MGPALVGIFKLSKARQGGRDRILKDIELLGTLPEKAKSRESLLQDIDRRVELMIQDDLSKRRNAFEIWLGAIFLLAAVGQGYLVLDYRGWWWLLSVSVVFCFAMGITGLTQGLDRVERDDKGKHIG
ncbi:hypothetical protein H7171_04095 [Candidatus Saccharibacteria bacterium]|nr:hypothetical protein [Candidatus Saccharibacteria bacterium]